MDRNRVDEFIGLFTAHEARLRAFVLTLVPRWSDAEEIMQQCNLVLWKKFGCFEEGTHFYAWACQIARLEAKDFRKRQARENVLFSNEFVDAVADQAIAMGAELNLRQAALQKCIEKLSPEQRRMVQMRYEGQTSVEGLSKALHRSVDAVYKALSRIRQGLFDCVTRTLAAEQ